MVNGYSSITSKGQVTIPKEIRDILGVKPGEKVEIRYDGESIQIRSVADQVNAVAGSLAQYALPGGPPSKKEMREAIEQEAVKRYLKAVSS